jgi:hypothetical protein
MPQRWFDLRKIAKALIDWISPHESACRDRHVHSLCLPKLVVTTTHGKLWLIYEL